MTTGEKSSRSDQTSGATYELARAAVARSLVEDALRVMHLDLLTRGASASELGKWLWAANWFPHLRHDASILALARALPHEWQRGEMCEPQILLQFPHTGPEPEITYHRDQEPAWASDRRYGRIVGIALSSWNADNGGLIVRPADRPIQVELEPGDAVMMTPDLWHTGGVNRTGSVRYAVYFRWLEDAGRARDAEATRPVAARSSASRAAAASLESGAGAQT